MYQYITRLTSTETTKTDEHRISLLNDLATAAEQGWELVSTDTLLRDDYIETLTYWKRKKSHFVDELPVDDDIARIANS